MVSDSLLFLAYCISNSDLCLLVAMSLNCSGMYRGLIREDGQPLTAIFDDDELD